MNIQGILTDWVNKSTHGEIKANHNVSEEHEFAITLCSDGLSIGEIENRLSNVKTGMTGKQIMNVMKQAK